MKTIEDFVSFIITEAGLDARISNGVVDLDNIEHIKVMAEIIYDTCSDETIVNEFLQKFLDEGKYPERQAYNKEGWLVTFPSKEYRDAAIKKRTHFGSDPTHGKGGMNLYYKKKGKQKRQTQQVASKVQSGTPSLAKIPKQQAAKQEIPTKNIKPGEITPEMMGDEEEPSSTQPRPITKTSTEKPMANSQEPSTVEKPAPKTPSAPQVSTSSTTPAIDVPVVTTPPKQYSEVSKKFASQKRWVPTPYDEYHDAEGNVVAVVGLSGEIVPVKNTDREEYKIFAEKNMPT